MSDGENELTGSIIKIFDLNAPPIRRIRKPGQTLELKTEDGNVYQGRVIACLRETSKQNPANRDITTTVRITGALKDRAPQSWMETITG